MEIVEKAVMSLFSSFSRVVHWIIAWLAAVFLLLPLLDTDSAPSFFRQLFPLLLFFKINVQRLAIKSGELMSLFNYHRDIIYCITYYLQRKVICHITHCWKFH